MSGVFMDGGGGGDGGGFDHGHDHGDHGHDMGGHPDQSPMWSQAMQGLKLNDFFSNIKITPNHLLLFMFMGFTGWLGVIYWIRHHEPMANHMLGSGPAYTPHFQADRLLINGAREALPIKTTSASGQVYTPGSNNAGMHAAAPAMPVYSSGVRFSTPRQNLAIQSSAINAPPSSMNAPGAGNYAMAPMASAAPMSNGMGHNARLFSNRDGVGPGGHTGVRGGAMSARMVGHEVPNQYQIRSNAPVAEQFAASPQAPPPGWSLAKDGFSSDTAHFDSRFGSPLESNK
ncbi:MAG: hypothetical protein WC714_03315 [Candidatus Obscuribacterales bacterium]|jgi:hypothetical protein